MDYPIKCNYRTKELVLVSGPESESLLSVLTFAYWCVWGSRNS